jgi:hypothetical protein
MDALYAFLEHVRKCGQARGNFLGLLNVFIGRRIENPPGTVISTGLTWRSLAALLKKLRWDREAVKELGLDPKLLPPRDRERYWYMAIGQAHIDSEKAIEAGDRLAQVLQSAGCRIVPGPK